MKSVLLNRASYILTFFVCFPPTLFSPTLKSTAVARHMRECVAERTLAGLASVPLKSMDGFWMDNERGTCYVYYTSLLLL